MRHFAWLCVVVGLGVAIAVPIKAAREHAAFVGSTDYHIWSALEDKRTWRPAGLRSATYWDGWRWPAVFGGSAAAVLGGLVLAIRRPVERETTQ
jgi:hypothetical protein